MLNYYKLYKMTSKKIEYWLQEGKQSKITPKIKKICSEFKGNDLEKIFQILNWINKNLKHERNYNRVIKIFASRNAEQLIKNKNSTGCHDTALILSTFLRVVGIPCKYLVGINKINPQNRGHCVIEAYVGKKWILIDIDNFQLNLIPSQSSFYDNYYIIREGLDSWDCKIKTFNDWKKASENLIRKINNDLKNY